MITYNIEINSSFEAVDYAVNQLLNFLSSQCNVTQEIIFKLNFALRELLINAVEHGNKMDKCKKASCCITYDDNKVIVDVSDEGDGFNIDSCSPSGPVEENILRLRGRGITTLVKLGFNISNNINHVVAKLDLEAVCKSKEESVLNKILNGSSLVLQLKTDLVASRAKDLVDKAKQYIEEEKEYKEVVLDISNVTIIDSIGVTFIIGLYKTAVNNGMKYKVIGVNKEIEQLFKLMKLDEIFQLECL